MIKRRKKKAGKKTVHRIRKVHKGRSRKKIIHHTTTARRKSHVKAKVIIRKAEKKTSKAKEELPVRHHRKHIVHKRKAKEHPVKHTEHVIHKQKTEKRIIHRKKRHARKVLRGRPRMIHKIKTAVHKAVHHKRTAQNTVQPKAKDASASPQEAVKVVKTVISAAAGPAVESKPAPQQIDQPQQKVEVAPLPPRKVYQKNMPTEEELLLSVRKYKEKIEGIKNEVRKGILGQDEVIDSVLKCMVSGGHVLLESVPGLAKTFLAMLLNETMQDSIFNRIQFTPDLLPTDITGVTVYDKIKGFYVMKGPIFANLVLADELNRTPPKVQSAMLQAMQENQVTIGRNTYDLPRPFFVIATQNPLEQRGVYPLSVAQVDRFLFKVFVTYPDEEDEFFVMDQNSNMKTIAEYGIKKVISPKEILEMQKVVRCIHISHELKEYIVNLVDATRNPKEHNLSEEAKYMQYGGSPRASIFMCLSAKATALLNGRIFVTPEDIKSVAKEVLRHRIILNYEGKAREINPDDIIDEIIKKVPVL
jgi:MoxR-like ATPase